MRIFLFCLFSVIVAEIAMADPMPVPKFGSCPSGSYSSGGSCVPKDDYQVYYNQGEICPGGWYRSGEYCVKSN